MGKKHNIRSKISVLMCTYNGEVYIEEQLDSIRDQKHEYIDLWVSDDGSTDRTLEILNNYQSIWNKGCFVIKKGPQQGHAANFLSLILDEQIKADYYAFSDQDDIWLSDKLTHAISFLKQSDKLPTLYSSRTIYVDEQGEDLGKVSPKYRKKASFANALVQSLAGGNTMVFNNEARNLVCQAGEQKIVNHDWWLYILITGSGGNIVYDSVPRIYYRQHSHNIIGSNISMIARCKRMSSIVKGVFRDWNEIHIKALENSRPLLTVANQELLDAFIEVRVDTIRKKMSFLKKKMVYRQTRFGNIGLLLAMLLNKF